MSKGAKEAEAKRSRDLREHRRQCKAAGLRSGEVFEVCPIPATDAGSNESSKNADASGGVGGIDSVDGRGLLTDKKSWRKVAPAELLRQAEVKDITTVVVEGPNLGLKSGFVSVTLSGVSTSWSRRRPK